MSDVLRTTGGIPRHQPQATMRGVHPRSPKGPGSFAYFKEVYDHVLQENAYP